MTVSYCKIAQGQLFWRYDESTSRENHGTLLFIHAGVADHTLWDDQTEYFTANGWNVLRYDIFGLGKSRPSEFYLSMDPKHRSPFCYDEHAAEIVSAWRSAKNTNHKVVVVGLSIGGAIATDFALNYPDLCSGLVVVAGGLSGFYSENTEEENEIFAQYSELKAKKDIKSLTKLDVRVWGDGPSQPEGRVSKDVASKLHAWCEQIQQWEVDGTGGFALEGADPEKPASGRLGELQIPVAVGIGLHDESSSIAAMRYLAMQTKGIVGEFNTAHMVNLEQPKEFNKWLEMYLQKLQ